MNRTKQLTQIFSQATKAGIKQRADMRIAELELRELLEADLVDMGQVEGKLKAIEGLRTTLRLSLNKAHEQAKGVLTPEQRQKLERPARPSSQDNEPRNDGHDGAERHRGEPLMAYLYR